MGKRAFIFPGQGSQYVGMGKDLFDNSKVVRDLFDKAEQILGYRISEIMFEGPKEKLRQTQITQPAIFLHSISILNLIDDVDFQAVSGHSLGEYTALVANNVLNFEEALYLVKKRSEAMAEAGQLQPGTMAAVIGLDVKTLEDICSEASKEGIVTCANFNSPGQIVISGSKTGVIKAMELSKTAGAKIVKELVVSGAFHSPLMLAAQSKLNEALNNTTFNDTVIPVYSNVSAKPVTSKNEIKNNLLTQLSNPVRWEETIVNMINDGISEFVEIGPGKVLQGLIKRIDKSVTLIGLDKFNDISQKMVLSND